MSDNVPDESILERLIQDALAVRQRAYAPYSRFQVGAALLTETGETVLGCNVENCSYSLTLCAERVAACTAVVQQKTRWVAIAIASTGGVTPCGSVSAVLSRVWSGLAGAVRRCRDACGESLPLSGLLPHGFTSEALPK